MERDNLSTVLLGCGILIVAMFGIIIATALLLDWMADNKAPGIRKSIGPLLPHR